VSEPTTPVELIEVVPSEADRMADLDRARLPVQTLAEAIPHLRRPFTPEAIRFKVQSVFKQQDGTPFACLVVAYIDARLASERLNRVIPQRWQAHYQPVDGNPKLMWCALSVDGVVRRDVGESPKGMSKDLVSDALKRAAVHFGVGVSCYALPQIRLTMSDSHGRIEIRGKGEKRTIALTEHGMAKLRDGYAKWLEEHGVSRFGAPLDHGDVLGVTIEEEFGVGDGEGDGTPPEWEGVSEEHVAKVEDLMRRAEAAGLPMLMDIGTVRMRLNGQEPAQVEDWIDAAEKQVAAAEAKLKPEGGE
jgi:hypothetical protein